ncbi:SOS response-associated peptidase [Fundicoccus sp. Sow4_D5]|uniref:SOS response-associated peptidase n=1 Tax=Fundicoccus sp. Sow4_D5 TaxID=3438782 RepID=UPI003F933826
MCGQYSYLASKKALLERYQLNPADIDSFVLDYAIEEAEQKEDTPNIFYPSGHHPILLPNQKIYHIQWGLTPSFAKRPLINARIETILEKKTFREPFMKKRCIVPATCFYEWQVANAGDEQSKTMYSIAVKDQAIFSMAGICERYSDGKGGSYLTFAILTTEPSQQMAPIHDRMPVILEPSFEQVYLDLELPAEEILEKIRNTHPHELLIEAKP